MRVIIGISLIAIGSASLLAATLFHLEAEAELLAKRPELGDGLYSWMPFFRKHNLVAKLYRAELPHGKRIRQFRMCAITGMLAFLFLSIMLGFFK